MADREESNIRKAVSLNDNHYRFLHDLSAPSKPKPTSTISSLYLSIASSPPPPNRVFLFSFLGYVVIIGSIVVAFVEEESEEEEFQVRRRLCKQSHTDDSIPGFSEITDFDSPLEEEAKPVKLKIEGRRRLCKVSSRDGGGADKTSIPNEPIFSGICDFDSPLQTKNVCEGGSQIRDILNDLSSKLELMSIEKKTAPKRNIPEYASAESSFSSMSDPSDTSSGSSKNVGGGGQDVVDSCEDVYEEESKKLNVKLVSARQVFDSNVEEKEEKSESQSDFGNDTFVTRVHESKKNFQRLKKNEPKNAYERLMSVGRSFASKHGEKEDDNDCVVLSSKQGFKKAVKCGGNLKKSDQSEEADELDDSCSSEIDPPFILSGPNSTFKLPTKVAKMLYLHQREGLKWLWSLHCQGKGGILGDDMGLGKTMQICGFLAGLFHSKLIKRALIVAPKTLLSHWIKELSVVGLSGKTREYFATSAKTRQYELEDVLQVMVVDLTPHNNAKYKQILHILQNQGILLTTYDIVRNNSKALKGESYYSDDDEDEDDIIWDYMILDEGHLIKNPSTQRAKSLLDIPSAHRIVISGTPIQNNLKELWALFNFCCPELLGDNKWFKERYEHAILRGNDKNASEREKRVGSTVAKELRERIQPYFLRRLKKEVFGEDDTSTAKLSKKNEIIVWLKLTACQRRLYEAFLNSEIVLSAFDGSPLAALTILKKICDHPLLLTKRAAEDVLEGMDSMLNPEDASVAEKLAMHVADVAETNDFQDNHDNLSCKISFLLSLLDTLIPEGHHILIFSQTRKMLNHIQESLVLNDYKFLRIDGTTKASDRVKIVNDFQEGNGAPIFLLTSQVGGLGLTLTKADRVIVVDPAWNPSTDNQSVDRAYRIGQTKDVLVYRLMTCGTVEEKIYRKQIYKGGLFKTATEHKEQIRYFSQQDLRELFSLPKQGFDISLTQKQLHEEHDSQHKMDELLETHIKFLETLGIAGVSHHSLLFSKTAPVQVVEEEDEDIRKKENMFVRHSSSSSSVEQTPDGAVNAFKPKDIMMSRKSLSPIEVAKLTESEINQRINRLSQIYANKITISRLPDKGGKIEKQIAELNAELQKIKTAEVTQKETEVGVDGITGQLEKVLNV
ncbi:protein CHROMATIN REMODELING 24 [Gossypium australe]|uniref:Protein CHROMATIN REMODELING 24 n=1 Tax=Gossypium australe TaxID=47621 RepID=A0A5B6UDJ2_9ROSI|nr:protein CHROMATIN REMODELING 24 [Gossypium australe]